MKLYEINEEILNCVDSETGEIIDFDKFAALHMERETKLENIVLWVKDLTAEAKAIREEELALAERRHTAEKKAESLKELLSRELAGQKFSTPKCSVSYRTVKSVNVTDIWKLPEDYLVYRDPEPDKKALRAALNDGENINGAELVEKQSVIIK